MRCWALVLALVLATGVSAAEPVRLARPAKASAFPRIAAPQTPATAKINAALTRLDRRWAGFVKACGAGGKDANAERRVETTMAGPRFLSLVARDEQLCGGAHPDTDTLPLVYDLEAGRPVDWRKLLGPRLVTAIATDTVIDGTTVGEIASGTLQGLYVRGAKPDGDCSEVLGDPGLKFVAWLDGRKRGLVIEPVLPHVTRACGDEQTIGLADLRRLSAEPALTTALADG